MLWHLLGNQSSEAGVQQVAQGGSIHSSGQGWYLDDGFLLGKKSFVLRALSIIQEFGPSLCLLKILLSSV